LLCYQRVAKLAKASALVHHAESIDARPMASFFARNGTLPQPLADYFAGFDVIISYLFDPDHIFQQNVARCSKAQFLQGPYRPEDLAGIHATDVFLQPLKRLDIFEPDPVPKLTLSAFAVERPELLLPPSPQRNGTVSEPRAWLAVHPGSGSERKNWPEESWAVLLGRLVEETRWNFLLLGGEAEGERLQRLAALLPQDRARIAASLPLVDVGMLLHQCNGYIGHDSGISHLAAALGVRGVILWGETRQEVWRPRSERMHIVDAGPDLADLPVEQVLGAVREWMG